MYPCPTTVNPIGEGEVIAGLPPRLFPLIEELSAPTPSKGPIKAAAGSTMRAHMTRGKIVLGKDGNICASLATGTEVKVMDDFNHASAILSFCLSLVSGSLTVPLLAYVSLSNLPNGHVRNGARIGYGTSMQTVAVGSFRRRIAM